MLSYGMTDDERRTILERHANELAEIYDAVQIVATWVRQDGTTASQKRGSGNWYARKDLCREFILEDTHDDQAKAIAKHLDPPEDWKS